MSNKIKIVFLSVIVAILLITFCFFVWLIGKQHREGLQVIDNLSQVNTSKEASLKDPTSVISESECMLPEKLENDSVFYSVDSKGGTICSLDKLMTLEIPANALLEAKEIKISTTNKRETGTSYEIIPANDHLIHFLKPCTQKIKFPNDSEEGSYSIINPSLYKKNNYGYLVKSETATFDEEKNSVIDFVYDINDGSLAYDFNIPQLSPTLKEKISNWKLYQNSKYGYEVKYPSDWSFAGNVGKGNEIQIDKSGAMFTVEVITKNDPKYLSLEKIKSGMSDKNSEYRLINVIKDVTIDGVKGFGYKIDYIHTPVAYVLDKGNYQYQILIFRGKSDDIEEVFSGILSTFKFIN